jgi:osmotically-inducible protein OsmY
VEGGCRGLGPRGYVRSDQRIYEDICDRLTEDPYIDPSNLEVTVHRRTVTLVGTVEDAVAARQAEEIAREVGGVAHVRNELVVAAADKVNSAVRTTDLR